MSYKIITDSGCDIGQKMKENKNFCQIPLKIYVDEEELLDDDNLDTLDLLNRLKNSAKPPSTASPSPQDFMENMMVKKGFLL